MVIDWFTSLVITLNCYVQQITILDKLMTILGQVKSIRTTYKSATTFQNTATILIWNFYNEITCFKYTYQIYGELCFRMHGKDKSLMIF